MNAPSLFSWNSISDTIYAPPQTHLIPPVSCALDCVLMETTPNHCPLPQLPPPHLPALTTSKAPPRSVQAPTWPPSPCPGAAATVMPRPQGPPAALSHSSLGGLDKMLNCLPPQLPKGVWRHSPEVQASQHAATPLTNIWQETGGRKKTNPSPSLPSVGCSGTLCSEQPLGRCLSAASLFLRLWPRQ